MQITDVQFVIVGSIAKDSLDAGQIKIKMKIF